MDTFSVLDNSISKGETFYFRLAVCEKSCENDIVWYFCDKSRFRMLSMGGSRGQNFLI